MIHEQDLYDVKYEKTQVKYAKCKRWGDFKLRQDLIEALLGNGMPKPYAVQSQTLQETVNSDRKKSSILIKAGNRSGKTMAYLIPILNSIESSCMLTVEDKIFKEKVQVNQIFKPQGIIIVEDSLRLGQIRKILRQYIEFGEKVKSQSLRFKIGILCNQNYEDGDIILTMPQSFVNRYQTENLELDNCKFIAIDEIDDMYEQKRETLAEILKITEHNRPKLISCSTKIKEEFINFYDDCIKETIKFNFSFHIQNHLKDVKHYYKISKDKIEMYNYILNAVFKHIYKDISKKPQIIIFFDSINEIKEFHNQFKKIKSSATMKFNYLQNLNIGICSDKKYQYEKIINTPLNQLQDVVKEFRDNKISIMLATRNISKRLSIINTNFVINVAPKVSQFDFSMYTYIARLLNCQENKATILTLVPKDLADRFVGGCKKFYQIDIKEVEEPPIINQEHKIQDKAYITSKKKWKDFPLHEDLIEALFDDGKAKPTRVQSQTLEVTVYPDRKKFNILIRAANGSGKTMAFLVPIMNSIEPGLPTAEDKSFKGKVQTNQIFKPQGVIIVQTNFLQDQIQRILKQYREFGVYKKSEKLNFKIGRLDKEKHEHGDIIVTMPRSFVNRYQRGNLKLNNCKFIAIDEVDDIYEQEKETLAEILKITEQNRPNLITCSATMKKQFLNFYEEHIKDVIKFNISQLAQTEKIITLEGVKNYFKVLKDKAEMHKYIIGTIFKHLYEKVDKKPQVLIFFDSIDEIKEFHEYLKARSSDFTSEESEHLQNLTVGIIAAKKYEDGKKVDMTITEKTDVMNRFRNNQTNILLATNIIARGIDMRNACFVINVGPPKVSERGLDIDLDIYIHRVSRKGGHNDKGIALTLIQKESVDRLVGGIKKIHKIEVHEMKEPEDLVNQVKDCIKVNSE